MIWSTTCDQCTPVRKLPCSAGCVVTPVLVACSCKSVQVPASVRVATVLGKQRAGCKGLCASGIVVERASKAARLSIVRTMSLCMQPRRMAGKH